MDNGKENHSFHPDGDYHCGQDKDGKYAYFVYNMSEKNPDNVAIANQSIVLRVPVTRIAGDPLLEKAKAKARQ